MNIVLNINSLIAKKVASKIKAKYSKIETKIFPDGETYAKIPLKVKGKKVAVFADFMKNPNEIMAKVLLTCGALKQQKAKKIVLVAPYLPYMRQDKEFKKGEAVSVKIFAQIISGQIDALITVDPHLHRVKKLSQVYKCETHVLSAVPVIAKYIQKKIGKSLIVGPDIESKQWVSKTAKKIKMPFIIAKKKRITGRKVEMRISKNFKTDLKQAIVVDDIISTGHTMIKIVKLLKKKKIKRIYCIGVHGLLVEKALSKLRKAGAKVLTTNSIQNPTSKIDISQIIAQKLESV